MSGINSLPSERAAVIAAIDPDSYAAGDQNSDYFDMSLFDSAMVIVSVGDMTAGDTLSVKVTESTSNAGAGEQDISGAAITQIVQGSPLGKNQQAIINLRASDFDMDDNFRWGRVVATVAGGSPEAAAVDVSVVVLGFDPKHGPASDNDVSSVAEIVSL